MGITLFKHFDALHCIFHFPAFYFYVKGSIRISHFKIRTITAYATLAIIKDEMFRLILPFGNDIFRFEGIKS